MSPITNTEVLKSLQEIQQRLSIIEIKQHGLEDDLLKLDGETEKKDDEYATKKELHLQLENIRLTIDMLKTSVLALTQRLEGLEINIVSEIKEITKKQQEEQITRMKEQQKDQAARMRNIIVVQSTVLILILGAFISAFFTLILPHLHP